MFWRKRSHLQPHTKTPNARSCTNPPNHDPNYDSVVAAINALIYTLKHNNESTEKQSHAHHQQTLRWNRLTFLGIAAYTALTFAIVYYTRSGSDAARDSLNAVQRAFVVVSGFKLDPLKDKEGHTTLYTIYPVIKNSGGTPTKRAKVITITPRDDVKRDIAFDHLPAPNDPDDDIRDPRLLDKIHYAVIGPHDELPNYIDDDFIINAATFSNIINFKRPGFIRGEILYRDVFKDTPPHITKFCVSLINFEVSAEGLRVSSPTFSFPEGVGAIPRTELCPHWNCADEECADDKRRYDAERSQQPTPGAANR